MRNSTTKIEGRTVGLDCHPDSFTAAMIEGQIPATARIGKVYNKLPIGGVKNWATKRTSPQDVIVLESSGNSFQVVRELQSVGRKGVVVDSTQASRTKKAYANNDKISAIRIGKAYLSGELSEVWVPDSKTQERRDWFHAQRKAERRTTQTTNRIRSYLSDNGVRLKSRQALSTQKSSIFGDNDWSPRQRQVLEGMFMDLAHGQEQRAHWKSLIAQEVLEDPLLLSMVRLCGIRDGVAFALGAIIGDIKRFANPKKLVAYVGLNPAFDQSGENKWEGGIGRHGRKDLRSLLMESAHSILRSRNHPLAKWGKKLMARKGSRNLAVAAMARKLTVAIWYLMNGKWVPFEELDSKMSAKVGKIITNVGAAGLKNMGKTRKELRSDVIHRLKKGRTYVLDPHKKYVPKPVESGTRTGSVEPEPTQPKQMKHWLNFTHIPTKRTPESGSE